MKSMPGRTDDDATAVTSTIESPYRITTEPSACLAIRPVSIVSSLPPKPTPSRTNIWYLLVRDPAWRFVPLLEGPAVARAARRPVRTPGKKDERRHRGQFVLPREPHARAAVKTQMRVFGYLRMPS